ncbi:hypothetical protein J4419_02220 [Candidatus Woesearchaeota archaeon]|nr:hypothetical protein [Candidatus Woesearchaeota archaeon]
MEEIVRKDILELLKDTASLLKAKYPNTNELKNISNRTVHNASIFQDEDSISFAVLIYSLSKVIERAGERIDYDSVINHLECGQKALENKNTEEYRKCIRGIFDLIKNLDTEYSHYIQDVFSQAAIRKGSHIYEHGISAAKTAELLGISLWELQRYLGATQSMDADTDSASVRQRLTLTRRLFE